MDEAVNGAAMVPPPVSQPPEPPPPPGGVVRGVPEGDPGPPGLVVPQPALDFGRLAGMAAAGPIAVTVLRGAMEYEQLRARLDAIVGGKDTAAVIADQVDEIARLRAALDELRRQVRACDHNRAIDDTTYGDTAARRRAYVCGECGVRWTVAYRTAPGAGPSAGSADDPLAAVRAFGVSLADGGARAAEPPDWVLKLRQLADGLDLDADAMERGGGDLPRANAAGLRRVAARLREIEESVHNG